MANKRVAVLVGCNYANTPYELHGCINDVLAMRDTLVSRFGFDPSHVKLLTDGPNLPIQPTGKNIMSLLHRLIDGAGPGDVLFFHYSGHGTSISSVEPGHPFRVEEAIVPCDFNLIKDFDFRQVGNRVPNEASFTIPSDSCHSGGLIDVEKEQIGPASANRGAPPITDRGGLLLTNRGGPPLTDRGGPPLTNRGGPSLTNRGEPSLIVIEPPLTDHGGPPLTDNRRSSLIERGRSIPIDSIVVHLSSLSGISSPQIADHLSHLFGEEASPKLRKKEVALPVGANKAILLSGCQANETSADMNPSLGGGKSYGAFCDALLTVLKLHEGALSNRELVLGARQLLRKQEFEQHPASTAATRMRTRLSCSSRLIR